MIDYHLIFSITLKQNVILPIKSLSSAITDLLKTLASELINSLKSIDKFKVHCEITNTIFAVISYYKRIIFILKIYISISLLTGW